MKIFDFLFKKENRVEQLKEPIGTKVDTNQQSANAQRLLNQFYENPSSEKTLGSLGNFLASSSRELSVSEQGLSLLMNIINDTTKFMEANEQIDWYIYQEFYDKISDIEKEFSYHIGTHYKMSIEEMLNSIGSSGFVKYTNFNNRDESIVKLICFLRKLIMLMRPFENSHEYWKYNDYTTFPDRLFKLRSMTDKDLDLNSNLISKKLWIKTETANKIYKRYIDFSNKAEVKKGFLMWLEREYNEYKKSNAPFLSFRIWCDNK